MRRPAGIIFDMGDTVLRCASRDFLRGNRRHLEFAVHNPGVTPEEIQSVADELFSWIDKARDESMIEFPSQSFQRLLYEILDISFTIDAAILEREFWNAAYTYVPVEGIYDVLDILDARGIKTGVLSNSIYSGAVLTEELWKHDLARRFGFLVSSADYGIRKPHELIFKAALKKIGLDPRDVWFVGDKIEYDICGAANAGLFPVWFNGNNESAALPGDCLEVKSWHEFRERLEQLL